MPNEYPQALEDLIERLGHLPGIGRRSAERMALALLEWDAATLQQLGQSLAGLRQAIRPCVECGNLADRDRCRICSAHQRDRHTLCVVEQARQIPVIEKSGSYHGLYHVLGGRLSPLDGIELEQLNVERLFGRITELSAQEVILSTSADVEGEATANCLADLLRERCPGVRISRIAQGLPYGSDFTYADNRTITVAFESRREVPGK